MLCKFDEKKRYKSHLLKIDFFNIIIHVHRDLMYSGLINSVYAWEKARYMMDKTSKHYHLQYMPMNQVPDSIRIKFFKYRNKIEVMNKDMFTTNG